jgi:hypothetical protein
VVTIGEVKEDQWDGGGKPRGNKGVNMIKVHHIHVWKCHNETHYFVQLVYANKNVF